MTVYGEISGDQTARSLEVSFYQRKNDNSVNVVNLYSNNNNNNNDNNNNQKNNVDNKDQGGDFILAQPWEAVPQTPPGQPTPKPTKAPTTDKPTKPPSTEKPTKPPSTEKPTSPPTTRKPTWAPVTRWPTVAPIAPVSVVQVTPAPATASPTPSPTLPPSTGFPTPQPTAALPVTVAPVSTAPIAASSGVAIYAIEPPPTLPPTPVPNSLATTLQPSVASTGAYSDSPTQPPTIGVSNTTIPVPTVATPSTGTPTVLPPSTSLSTSNAQPIKQKDLEDIQVIPIGNRLQNISISFSIWLPDREGANEADHDSASPGIQTALRSALEYLFCDSKKDFLVDESYWQELGVSDYYQVHRLCAFSKNVVDGDGMIGTSTALQQSSVKVDGGRNRELKNEEVVTDLEAYEKGKWDPSEWTEIDQKFAEWQDRAGDSGNKATNVIETDSPNTIEPSNQNEKENNDKNSDEKDIQQANDKDNAQASDNDNDQSNANKQAKDEENGDNTNTSGTTAPGSDASVLLQPPQLHPQVHFNAHKNLAYTSWNVSWPVVRLSMDYLEEAWNAVSKGGDVTSDDVVAYGIMLMQNEIMANLHENVNLRVLDVVLEEMLQEPVRVSMVGHEKNTFGIDLLINEGDASGNRMRAVHPDPHVAHTLRLVGISCLLLTLKLIFVLNCLSRRRKQAREAEYQRLREGKGMLQVNGVEEMLNKTKTTLKKNPDFVLPRHHQLSQTNTDPDDEWHIPMPSSLAMRPPASKNAAEI